MLKKMVNGVEIPLTDEEEKNTLAFWDLNTKYPEYVGCCAFDGVNPPYHDIEAVRCIRKQLFEDARKDALDKISEAIELALENAEEVKDLYAKRKKIRSAQCPDLSDCKTVEEVNAMVFDL